MRAAARERDETWADVPFAKSPPGKENEIPENLIGGLLNALSPARRDALILESFRAETDPLNSSGPAFRLLRGRVSTPMGEGLAREVLRRIEAKLAASEIEPCSMITTSPLFFH